MRSDAGEVDAAGAVLDDDQRIEAPQEQGVHVGGRLVTLSATPDQELAGRYKVNAMSSSSSRTPAS